MEQYLEDEHKKLQAPEKKGQREEPMASYRHCPCPANNEDIAPKQQSRSMDCGVFVCLFMDLVMNKVKPRLLFGSSGNVTRFGRYALCHAIRQKKTIFECFFNSTAVAAATRTQDKTRITDELLWEQQQDQNYKSHPLKQSDEDTSKRAIVLMALPNNQSPYLHLCTENPYIEELAKHHQDGTKETSGSLQPLQRPCEFVLAAPKLSDGLVWSYDPKQRVVRFDVSTTVREIPREHKEYLGLLMERDDITVISKGLFPALDQDNLKSFLDNLGQVCGSAMFHKFRRYDRVSTEDGVVTYQECFKGFVSMKVSSYIAYLDLLQNAGEGSNSKRFRFEDSTGIQHEIEDVAEVVFYLVDMEMEKHCHKLDEWYKRDFKMKEILPGGAWCMMNHVSIPKHDLTFEATSQPPPPLWVSTQTDVCLTHLVTSSPKTTRCLY